MSIKKDYSFMIFFLVIQVGLLGKANSLKEDLTKGISKSTPHKSGVKGLHHLLTGPNSLSTILQH